MSANKHLVSVIVPAFNAARWITETIASVVSQSYSNLEIVIVDDGSSDDTARIASGLNDPRIHVVRQPQRGAAAARNTGLSTTNGELVQFLDADDLISPRKIELQVEALEHAPDGSIASCEWIHLGPAGVRKAGESVAWRIQDPLEWLIASLRGGGMMQPAAWLTPRNLIDRAGRWNEALTLHDDGEFFARVLVNCAANIFVKGAVVWYRDNPAGLSRQRSRRAVESALAVCRSRHAILMERRSDEATRIAIATQYAQFVYEFASHAPDLIAEAMHEVKSLGATPEGVIGGRAFRAITRIAGFPTAMRIRTLSHRVRS